MTVWVVVAHDSVSESTWVVAVCGTKEAAENEASDSARQWTEDYGWAPEEYTIDSFPVLV